VDEFARRLYRWLRDADASHVDVVLAVAPDESGIGAAVADRLRRAAGSRAEDSGP
jgi:L-threonylcarbamoyladenylate synthase